MVSTRPTIVGQVGTNIPPPPNQNDDTEETREPQQPYQPDTLSDQYDWRTKFRTDMVSQVEKWADLLGVSKFALDSLVRDHIDGAVAYINKNVIWPNRQHTFAFDTEEGIGFNTGEVMWQPKTADDWNQIWNAGLLYYSAVSGLDLAGLNAASRGRGGGGRRGPSAQDIRNMFDEDELTDAVQNMWGAHLMEDTPNARKIAKQYIEAVVASGGEKEIDFQTYIKNEIKKSSRYAMMYQNKPEGMEDLAYIAPYVSTASSVIGGGSGNRSQLGDVVAGGAALGASQDAFVNRLKRTNQYTGSQGFITGLEDRVRGVKNLLRG